MMVGVKRDRESEGKREKVSFWLVTTSRAEGRTEGLSDTDVDQHIDVGAPVEEGSLDLLLVEGSSSGSGVGGKAADDVGTFSLSEESVRPRRVSP
jgi:hypothetical protein